MVTVVFGFWDGLGVLLAVTIAKQLLWAAAVRIRIHADVSNAAVVIVGRRVTVVRGVMVVRGVIVGAYLIPHCWIHDGERQFIVHVFKAVCTVLIVGVRGGVTVRDGNGDGVRDGIGDLDGNGDSDGIGALDGVE